jgi:hypothetical protein
VNPDDLLNQIRDLLQQYMALGPDTPVAQQAGDLLAAIEATGGGGEAGTGAMGMGAMPPPTPDVGGAGAPPPIPMGDEMPPEGTPTPTRRGGSSSDQSFRDARDGARDFLKKKKGSKAA